jgi:hypothetical protein
LGTGRLGEMLLRLPYHSLAKPTHTIVQADLLSVLVIASGGRLVQHIDGRVDIKGKIEVEVEVGLGNFSIASASAGLSISEHWARSRTYARSTPELDRVQDPSFIHLVEMDTEKPVIYQSNIDQARQGSSPI